MKKALSVMVGLILGDLGSFGQNLPATESSLRSALSTGGTLNFTTSGTIALTSPLVVSSDLTIDGSGQNVNIDGQNITALFHVNPNIRLSLRNLTISRGAHHGLSAFSALPGFGGAIQNDGGIVTIINCSFDRNSALGGDGLLNPVTHAPSSAAAGALGGAIWQNSGSLFITNSAFTDNRALSGLGLGGQSAQGGAIFVNSGLAVVDGTTFLSNNCTGGGWLDGRNGEGAAIYLGSGQLQIRSSTLRGNQAVGGVNGSGLGGAISATAGSVVVSNCYLIGNFTTGGFATSRFSGVDVAGYPAYGGALWISSAAQASIEGSTFQENVSQGGLRKHYEQNFGPPPNGVGYGGAIYNSGTSAIVNCTFACNSALNPSPTEPSFGAAIYNNGSVGLTNVTVVNNTNHSAQAVLANASGTFVLKNSLLGKNFGSNGSGITDAGNNLSVTATPAFTTLSSQNNLDLKLGPLGNYGGPAPTIPILAGSPAINAADDAASPPTDQRGRMRPFGAHSDVGAFESSAPFVVLGRITGTFGSGATASIAANQAAIATDGSFQISNLTPGVVEIAYAAANTIFRTNQLSLDLHADTFLTAKAFLCNEFAYDLDFPSPAFSFAGRAGEQWEFKASSDLNSWAPIRTNQFNSDSLFTIQITNTVSPFFLIGIKK